ncbi:MAG: PEP-CTERM sorting domain-containing protein [Acidobacteriaceae bacterium]
MKTPLISKLMLATALLLLPAFAFASTQTINFDDIPDNGGGTQVPNGYHGFNWNNFFALNTPLFTVNAGPSGYANGTVSSPNIAYNGFGAPADFSGTNFSLVSGYFTGAWNDGLNIEVQGFDAAHNMIDDVNFLVNTSGPTLETFNWSGLYDVNFISSGGVNHGYAGSGTQFALDDLTVGTGAPGVPEPGSLVLLGTGFIGLLGAARRRLM